MNAPTLECASAQKLKLDLEQFQNELASGSDHSDYFMLINISLLQIVLSANLRCGECKEHTLQLDFDDSDRDGFCHQIKVFCTSADCMWQSSFKTSSEIRKGSETRGHKEVKIRMVSFARSIGRGHFTLVNFSQHLNSPPPLTLPAYTTIASKVGDASREVGEESMIKAALEVRQANSDTDPMKCGVSVDGSWQRRGDSSHNGVVTAISVETGKCLDVSVLTNV
ncbi:forkhead box protein k1 [Plakobranchus ocellatus]|uniref:Forkhead box protein k1 n=1 Tax=Plakobranchus ocellatus TaxID=259542 RepID=A0AAV4ASA8_9GAST|nr:forkhead box protein k1 [Plakobranchus ocellatus]